MIEKQLEDRMLAAFTDEPPLGFDPDELADRARSRRRRRRSTIAAAGATGAVLAVAVTAVVVAGGRGTETGSRVPATTEAGSAAPATTGDDESFAKCRSVETGTVPPLNFPGSAAIVDRLDASARQVIATHLPGVTVQPSETGMIAYDCPPNVGTVYQVNGVDQSVMLYMIRSSDELDFGADRYAGDEHYRLIGEEPVGDGARLRAYESVGQSRVSMLVVVRFGPDGMVTEAAVSGLGSLVADRGELTALASDPELRF